MISKLLEDGPRIRRYILLALVIGVPVSFLRVTSDPFNVPKLFLLIVGVAAAAALRVAELLQGRNSSGLRAMLIPASLLSVPLLVAWMFSPYRSWALLGLQGRFQGLLPYLLVIVFGVLVADAFRAHTGELAFALCWSGAVVGGYALIQALGLDPFDWSLYGAPTKAISTTGNPNFTGGFLGIVLPVGFGLALSDPGRRRVVIRLLAFTVAGWFAARSQGGWAAGVAGSAIVAGYVLRDRYRLAHFVGWLGAFLVGAVTIGVVVVAMIRPESRFTTGAAVDRSAWSEAAFGMGLASPVVGRGPNAFAIEGVKTRPLDDALEFNFDFPDDPHSVPMSMFANLGLFGLIGFVGVLGWSLWYFWRIEDPPLLQVAFMAGVVAYFVQSLVSIDELTLRVGLWTVLGALAASSFPEQQIAGRGKRTSAPPRKRSSKVRLAPIKAPVAVGGLALVALAGVAWAGSILIADVLARQASVEFAGGDVESGHAKYVSALSLRNSADYRGQLAFNLKAAAFDSEGNVDRERAEGADEAFSYTEDVPYLFSIVSRARLLHDVAAAQNNISDRALELYRSAIAIDPLNPLLRAEAALALEEANETDEALTLLSPMKDVVGDRYPQFWGALALVAAREQREDLAREAIGRAEALSPGESNAAAALKLLEGEPRN